MENKLKRPGLFNTSISGQKYVHLKLFEILVVVFRVFTLLNTKTTITEFLAINDTLNSSKEHLWCGPAVCG